MEELEVGAGRHRAAVTATLDEAREWLDAQVHVRAISVVCMPS